MKINQWICFREPVLFKYYIITIKGTTPKGLGANNARGTLGVASGDHKIISIPDCYLIAIKETRNGPMICMC